MYKHVAALQVGLNVSAHLLRRLPVPPQWGCCADVALEMPFTFPGNVPRTAVHKQTSAVEATTTSPARQKSLAAESDGAAGQVSIHSVHASDMSATH